MFFKKKEIYDEDKEAKVPPEPVKYLYSCKGCGCAGYKENFKMVDEGGPYFNECWYCLRCAPAYDMCIQYGNEEPRYFVRVPAHNKQVNKDGSEIKVNKTK